MLASFGEFESQTDHSQDGRRPGDVFSFGAVLYEPAECRDSAGSFVPVRRGLQLRPDVHVRGLPARERTPDGEPVTHGVGSVCMMLALVPLEKS
jgi:hypothetical protein